MLKVIVTQRARRRRVSSINRPRRQGCEPKAVLVEQLAGVAASDLGLEKEMVNSTQEPPFPPFGFTPRAVSIATDGFDFEQWKREPSTPIVLKGTFKDWPLLQNLRNCRTDEARLDYLSSAFGKNMVGYTKVPARDPFMGYDENGKQNFKYASASCKLSEFCVMMRAALRDPDSDVLYARGGCELGENLERILPGNSPPTFSERNEPQWGRHMVRYREAHQLSASGCSLQFLGDGDGNQTGSIISS